MLKNKDFKTIYYSAGNQYYEGKVVYRVNLVIPPVVNRLISIRELRAVAIKHLVELSVEHEFFCHFSFLREKLVMFLGLVSWVKKSDNDNLKYFSFFFSRNWALTLHANCFLLKETICLKCQNLFSWKIEKNIYLFFFFFFIWVLQPFQEYLTYHIKLTVPHRWAKTGEPAEKPPDHP